MLNLEQYIAKRKNEDELNEWDFDKRSENTKICVNYIFEYFNNYIKITPEEEQMILQNEKIEKYRKTLSLYGEEVKAWLVTMYAQQGHHLNRRIPNYIEDDYFFLYDSEAEFRALAYNIYPCVKKKLKYLEGQTDNIYRFLKDYHRINSIDRFGSTPYFSDNMNQWIENTYNEHGVNVYQFAQYWANCIYEEPSLWPRNHKKINNDYLNHKDDKLYLKYVEKYEYDYKQKSNLFNIDTLYRKMPKKSFTNRKKQEFEIMIMYSYLHDITGDEDYWDEYQNKVFSVLD